MATSTETVAQLQDSVQIAVLARVLFQDLGFRMIGVGGKSFRALVELHLAALVGPF